MFACLQVRRYFAQQDEPQGGRAGVRGKRGKKAKYVAPVKPPDFLTRNKKAVIPPKEKPQSESDVKLATLEQV
jgi:hypothetical protein